MKDYNEMARNVLERRDQYLTARKTAKRRSLRAITAAFCVALAVVIGTELYNRPRYPDVVLPSVEDLQHEMPGKQSEVPREPKEEYVTPPVIDVPIVENPGSTGTLVSFEEIWGGSYTDEIGRMVIWLTENTPENQTEVFLRNPALNAENTIFKTADYSLDYLTRLLADISEGMGSKQLPFVPSAAVREDQNRVEVCVIGREADKIAAILAYDSVGGAIEIKEVDGFAGEDLLVIEK